MGNKRKGGKKRNLAGASKRQKASEGDAKKPEHSGPWKDFCLENADFEAFYKGLVDSYGLFPASEWDSFISALRQPLPTTFRITSSGLYSQPICERLQSAYPPGGTFTLDGIEHTTPRPIPWYPKNLAWYTSVGRNALRKAPELGKLHQFLVGHCDQGTISRQEAVSMIPAFMLEIEAHHKVLDMCAAPGSKTAQLLEFIHAAPASTSLPAGLVVANDSNLNRCYTLWHQIKRINSPTVLVTNHEAQIFPHLRLLDTATPDGAAAGSMGTTFLFDRILADVPCSGDGTLRKNADIWKRWHTSMGMGLHKLQLRIAMRGAILLQVGGLMVYSTCSFNPVEDEAVVAELLRRSNGALELVDISSKLPGLKTSPGLSDWKIMDKDKQWYETYLSLPFDRQLKLPATLFPPADKALIESFHLERCMRLFPQQQDTGGFFVALLRKLRPITYNDWLPDRPVTRRPPRQPRPAAAAPAPPAVGSDAAVATASASGDVTAPAAAADTADTAAPAAADTAAPAAAADEADDEDDAAPVLDEDDLPIDLAAGDENENDDDALAAAAPADAAASADAAGAAADGTKATGSERKSGWCEEPFLPLPAAMAGQWATIKDYFGISADFPSECLLSRSDTDNSTKLYFVSPCLHQLVAADAAARRSLKIVNTGVRMFTRIERNTRVMEHLPCSYRLAQEGVPYLMPFLSDKRLVVITNADFRAILATKNTPVGDLSAPVAARVAELGQGSAIFRVDPSHPGPSANTAVAMWLGIKSVQILVAKDFVEQLRRLLLPAASVSLGLGQKSAAAAASATTTADASSETPA